MILRKPYAFFIKYFKLIHFIMVIFMGILVIQTNNFLNFFNQYINQNMIVIGEDLVSQLFMKFTYFYIIFVIIMDIVVWVLLEFKQKKSLYYVFNFFVYVLLLAFFIYLRAVFISMGEQIVDIRLIMVLRDVTIICFTFQAVFIFLTFIRAIGLNIKQFDFENDLKELNIDEKDNEEFEVNVELDSHKIKRDLRTTLRNFRYYFLENVRLIIPILCAFLIAIGIFTYQKLNGRVTKYKEGQVFNVSNYSLKVVESYVTDKDYRLSSIGNNKSLVVLKISVKTTTNISQFIFGKFSLQIGKNQYYHKIEYNEKVKDLGKTYIKQKLTKQYKDYLLIYEIPSSLKDKKMNLVYVNEVSSGILGSDKLTNVSITPIKLDVRQDAVEMVLNQVNSLTAGVFAGTTFTLKEAAVSDMFRLNYKNCVTPTECYSIYEPLQAPFYGSYDKSLLKISIDFTSSNSSVNNGMDFITSFGKLIYKIGDTTKTLSIQNQIVPTKLKTQAYYFEIPKEVISADSIKLTFNMRNGTYEYQIR